MRFPHQETLVVMQMRLSTRKKRPSRRATWTNTFAWRMSESRLRIGPKWAEAGGAKKKEGRKMSHLPIQQQPSTFPQVLCHPDGRQLVVNNEWERYMAKCHGYTDEPHSRK